MSRKAEIDLINKAFHTLANEFGLMYRIAETAADGERRHRRGDFRRFHPRAVSTDTCARYFAVKFVVDYATRTDRMPTIADVAYLRQDALLAASLVAEFGADRILRTLRGAGINPDDILALDYTDLIGEARAPAY